MQQVEEIRDPLRPPDYQKMNVHDLAAELERQAKTKRDVVVDSRTLRAIVGEQAYQDGDEVKTRKILKMDVMFPQENHEKLALTPNAHRQLAQKCNIPLTYYKRMMEAGYVELMTENVNAWIETKDKRLIRTLDGRVRAILSDRYKIIDNYDLLFLSLKKFKEAGANISRIDLSDTHMYIKALNPEMSVDIAEYKKSTDWRQRVMDEGHQWLDADDPRSDILQGGIVIKNSEVGASRFSIEPYVLRLKCNNGLIGTEKFQRTHLGSEMEIGEVFKDRTKALADETLWAKVEDFIDAAMNPEIFQEWIINGMGPKTTETIAEPTEAIDNVVGKYKLSDNMKKNILDNFVKEQDTTQWGLLNAMTATARDLGSYDHQIELEKVAGELSEMTVTDMNKIIGQ